MNLTRSKAYKLPRCRGWLLSTLSVWPLCGPRSFLYFVAKWLSHVDCNIVESCLSQTLSERVRDWRMGGSNPRG